jgi:hypothetical protein
MRNALKVGLVLRVGLDAEGSSKDELTDTGTEAGKESVERLPEISVYVRDGNWSSQCSMQGFRVVLTKLPTSTT